MIHFHLLDTKGKTLTMSINPIRVLWLRWHVPRYKGISICTNSYRWFDRKAHKWRGTHSDKRQCTNAN